MRPVISPGRTDVVVLRLVAQVGGEADRVAPALEPRPVPLPLRQRHREVFEAIALRHRAEAEGAEQRAVDGDVGVPADRAREVAVERRREARVPGVRRRVAGLHDGAEDQRRPRLRAAAGGDRVTCDGVGGAADGRRRVGRCSTSGSGGVGTSRSASCS